MLSVTENALLTQTGAGTPMGELFRRFWHPVLLSEELTQRDGPPVRLRVLGEDLVAFRDTQGKVGIVGIRLTRDIIYCQLLRAIAVRRLRGRGNSSIWDNTASKRLGKSRLKNREAGVDPSEA